MKQVITRAEFKRAIVSPIIAFIAISFDPHQVTVVMMAVWPMEKLCER